MSIKMKPTSQILVDLGLNENGDTIAYATETCYRYMDDFVPMRTGDLASIVDVQKNKIVYEMPYARYMYYEKVMAPNIPIKEDGEIVGFFSPPKKYVTERKINYNTDKHKNAGGFWDKRMWSAKKNEVIKEIQKYVENKK